MKAVTGLGFFRRRGRRHSSRPRIFIPTRDSARWVGIFLDAYRRLGVEPLYVVDARSTDGTLDLLREKGADCVVFTPGGDFAESGMIEAGARAAGGGWLLRLDDDEFPSRALVDWIGARTGSLNQVWQISRRELYREPDGAIVYSRAPTRYPSVWREDFLHPQPRFFHAGRVRFIEQVHTCGYEDAKFFDFAPEQAFIIHCNCLLRTPAERFAKMARYEAIRPGGAFIVADECLPEIFPASHHDAGRDGLEEFVPLFDALREICPEDRLVFGWPGPGPSAANALQNEVDRHRRAIEAAPRLPFDSADALWWLKFIPRTQWRRAAELVCTLGFRESGALAWSYLKGLRIVGSKIEWSDDAVSAAILAWFADAEHQNDERRINEFSKNMRKALDAAAAVQGAKFARQIPPPQTAEKLRLVTRSPKISSGAELVVALDAVSCLPRAMGKGQKGA